MYGHEINVETMNIMIDGVQNLCIMRSSLRQSGNEMTSESTVL